MGAVAPKYVSLGEDEEGEDNSAWGIPQRIKNLAKVLSFGHFDLVALQELNEGERGQWAMSDLVKQLKDAHGQDYEFFMSDGIGRGLIPEAIGFLYNPAKVAPVVIDGTTRLVDNIEIPGRDLARTQWKAGDFDFTLISAHLAWGNQEHRNAGYKEIGKILTTPVPSAYSRDPDTIVLGDFNRFGKGFNSVEEIVFDGDNFLAPNITAFDPEFNAKKSVTQSSISHRNDIPDGNPQFLFTTVAGNESVYDIIFLTPDCDEEFTDTSTGARFGKDFGIIHFDEPGGFGFQAGTDQLGHNDIKVAYSDHRPLWMRFKTNAGAEAATTSATSQFVETEFGKNFHLPGCSTIDGRSVSAEWTNRSDAIDNRGPCRVCKPKLNDTVHHHPLLLLHHRNSDVRRIVTHSSAHHENFHNYKQS